MSEPTIMDVVQTDKTPTETEELVEHNAEKKKFALPDWLGAETGDGTIEEYLDHPLNFNKSAGMAQVIRGATGMFGSLNKAVIDIVLGVLQYAKEKKKVEPVQEFTGRA